MYTTRDQKFVTSAHEVINFGSRDPVVARRMLLRHAGSHGEGSLSGNNKDAFEAILRMCNGLPPALGIAGSSVLEISAGHKCKLDMRTTYLRDFASEDLTSGSFDAYGDLTKIVGISLKVLSHRAERDDDEERLQHTGGDKHYEKKFRVLCVLRKQQAVPLQMLRKLWNIASEAVAKQVVENPHRVSLVQTLYRNGTTHIQLHDEILNIAIQRAKENSEFQASFQMLVYNYAVQITLANHRSDEISSSASNVWNQETSKKRTRPSKYLHRFCRLHRPYTRSVGEIMDKKAEERGIRVPWWDITHDRYIHDILCTIIGEAGYKDELKWLLSKPQWIVMRLQKGGISTVEEDLDVGKAVLEVEDSAYRKHLDALGKAARMSCTFVNENPYEAWFQLYGRLLCYSMTCKKTEEFARRIEVCASRPWAKAGSAFLQQAGCALTDVLSDVGYVRGLLQTGDKIFVRGHGGAHVRVTEYNVETSTREVQEFDASTAIEGDYVRCGILSHDLPVIAIGYGSGKIVTWIRE